MSELGVPTRRKCTKLKRVGRERERDLERERVSMEYGSRLVLGGRVCGGWWEIEGALLGHIEELGPSF